jgi:5-amino-6-(5-phosphoribosylamino)uracil reductase
MKVFSNLAISVDGKIADARVPHKMLGTPLDRKTMQTVRKKCDIIVCGAQTLRASGRAWTVKGAKRQPANAVVTASGKLDPSLPFWDDPTVIRWIFTTRKGFDRALESAKDRAFVIMAGEEQVEAGQILRRLKQSDYENVLVEGGGELMATFLAENLLQELHVTLTPWLLGGSGNPTLVGGAGLPEWRALKILSSKKLKNEVYLRFQVKGAKRV